MPCCHRASTVKIKRYLSIVLMILLLSSCSRVKIAYRQLDWLLPFYLETYMQLSTAQRNYLEEQVEELLAWHCASHLDQYAGLLREANSRFQSGQMRRADLDDFRLRIIAYWFDLMRKASPVLSELLLTANREQLQELLHSLTDKNRQWLVDYQELSAAELQEEYRESITDELQKWFGELQPGQLQLVDVWVERFQPLGMEGWQMRWKWQARLRELLELRRDAAAFRAGIEELLLHPERLRSDVYQRRLDDNAAATIELLYQFSRQMDAGQRRHLQREILAMAGDFDDLACLGGPSIARMAGRKKFPVTAAGIAGAAGK